MACTCPFKAKLEQTFAYLKQHQPADYANLEALSPSDWAALVNLTAQAMSEEGGTEPTFKPHPFGSCYLLADLNYAQAVTTCNIINDPDVKAKCLSTAREIYCEALELCGDPK